MVKTLFLHGLGQDHTVWKQTIDQMRNMVDPLCPNLFQSNSDSISFDQTYRCFQKEVESCDEKINLCGLSLGAVLALQYGIEHP